MNKILVFIVFVTSYAFGQSYAPAAGESGSTAIHFSDPKFVSWAGQIEVVRGFVNIEDTTIEAMGDNRATFGEPSFALGVASSDPGHVVSLGDKGVATLIFERPVFNGPGFDFAIFENSFSDTYLELAHVEVSSNGENFIRFPSHCEVQYDVQIHGFGSTDPKMINNLAGKYRGGFGTPFDLEELTDSVSLDVNNITHIRIIDVVGSVGDSATFDSFGNKINEPYSTPYESGGFDLDAVGVINQVLNVNQEKKTPWKIYPNPAKDQITIDYKIGEFRLLIFTISGQKILDMTYSNKSSIQLPKGIYYFHMITDLSSSVHKVVFH